MSLENLDLADQIDQIAERRGCFRPDNFGPFYTVVKSYMNGTTSVEDAVIQIVSPINKAYTTADGGKAFTRIWSQEEAEESGCFPETYTESKQMQSTEDMLWELWYSVLHVAKKVPWKDSSAQGRLVNLVRALKDQPDPEVPVNRTDQFPIGKNWIWSTGTLWSSLSMLGPSTRESWNDGPNEVQIEIETAEIHAWANVNAFVARLTGASIKNYWIYAIWALRDGVEGEHHGEQVQNAPDAVNKLLDARVPAAAAWVIILGNALYERQEDLTPKCRNSGNPGAPGDMWKKRGGKPEFSKARWAFWKERFEALRSQEGFQQNTKDIAAEACKKMEECENSLQQLV